MTDYQIKELGQRAYDLGFFYEKKYRGCAQCTIAAVVEVLEIDAPALFKSASALASGGGLTCEGSCGGFSGGAMVIGMLTGRRLKYFDDDQENKMRAFRMTRELAEKFNEFYGSVICEEIHEVLFGRHYNLWDNSQKDMFEADGAHLEKCTSVVGNSARWTIEIILTELGDVRKQTNLVD